MLCRKGILVCLLLAALSVNAEESSEWSIEEAKARTHLLNFTASEGTWMGVDVSPDGERLVFDLLGHLYEMPIDGGKATRLTDGRSWNMQPRYGPQGLRIAFTSDRGGGDNVWLMDADGG